MRSKKQVIYPQLQIYEKQNLLDRLTDKNLEFIKQTSKINHINKKRLNSLKDTTIKNMIYTNVDIPTLWRHNPDYKYTVNDIIMKDKRFFDYVSSSVPKEQETVYSPEIMLTENNAFTFGKSPVKTKSSLKSNKEMEPLLTFSNKTKGAEALKQEGDNSTILNFAFSNVFHKSSFKDLRIKLKDSSVNVNSSSPNNLKKEFLINPKSLRMSSNLEEKRSIFTNSVKSLKTNLDTQGPFLNNHVLKPVEIKNPYVKQMITQCEGYGPYYSHCLICNNKNLGYFKDLKTDDAVKVLKYIQKSKTCQN